jgi:hypothetical protein
MAVNSRTKLESAISALAEWQFHSEENGNRYRVFERSKLNRYARGILCHAGCDVSPTSRATHAITYWPTVDSLPFATQKHCRSPEKSLHNFVARFGDRLAGFFGVLQTQGLCPLEWAGRFTIRQIDHAFLCKVPHGLARNSRTWLAFAYQ